MLNYEKTLVIIAYHKIFEGLVKLHVEEPVVSQVRPVTHSSSNISYVHDSKIRQDHYSSKTN